jgi:uroporphyrinogen-III synthase
MRVIVTRPLRDAQRWAQTLAAQGLDAVVLPLIDIAPVEDARAVQRLADYRAVMFVSGNAVNHFLHGAHLPFATRAWAPGPGTRDALLDAGVDASLIDAPHADAAQFDSESLWQQVSAQVHPGDRVLVVRGRDPQGRSAGRDWLALQIEAAGAQVEFVAVYERRAPGLDDAQQALALRSASDGSVWLFSSSEAVANLRALLPDQSWQQARAVATHPRIAQAARDAGFAVVCESRPALADVVASIESFA